MTVPQEAITLCPENTRSEDDSPMPAETYTYPHWQRALCWLMSCWRYSRLLSSSLLADRFRMISAPSTDSIVLGGSGAHKSSHSSMPKHTPSSVSNIA